MKALETTKIRKATETILKDAISALGNAMLTASKKDQKSLVMIMEGKVKELEFLTKNKTWNFNFMSGGWNTVHAQDKEQAIKEACEQYNETVQRFHSEENGGAAIPLTKVNESTFRVATEADTKALLSLFY